MAIPQAAKADIAKLAELRDKLREAKDAYWSEIVDIQWQVASAWLLYAEGKYDDGAEGPERGRRCRGQDREGTGDAGVPIMPARELYGMMLLERGMAKEALAAFEATLKKEPNRLGAEIGAARAAEKAGDLAAAKRALRRGGCAWRGGRSGAARDRRRPRLRGEGEVTAA